MVHQLAFVHVLALVHGRKNRCAEVAVTGVTSELPLCWQLEFNANDFVASQLEPQLCPARGVAVDRASGRELADVDVWFFVPPRAQP